MLDNLTQHLQSLQYVFTTPLGLTAVVLGGVATIAAFASSAARWGMLAVVLWLSTFGINDDPWINHTLVPPLEQLREMSRPLFVVGMLMIAAVFGIAERSAPYRTLHPGSLLLAMLHVALAARLAAEGYLDRGFAGMFVHASVFIAIAVNCANRMHSFSAMRATLQALALSGVLFTVAMLVQALLRPSAAVWMNRLFGITGNPQHAAQFLCLFMLPTLYLATNAPTRRPVRTFLYVLLSLQAMMLLWTGSRTGILMLLVGLLLYYRLQIHRLVLSAILVGIAMLGVLMLVGETDVTSGWGRVFSTENTRAGAWTLELRAFLASPWFGNPELLANGTPLFRETSYLAAAKTTGVIGLMLMGAAVVSHMVIAWGVVRNTRGCAPEVSRLTDLIFAMVCMIAAGALFEAYLMATVAPAYVVLYLIGGLAMQLRAASQAARTDVPHASLAAT